MHIIIITDPDYSHILKNQSSITHHTKQEQTHNPPPPNNPHRHMRCTHHLFLLLLLFATLLASLTTAKTVHGVARLESRITEAYLGKFSFSSHINDGHIEGEFVVDRNHANANNWLQRFRHELQVVMFDDAELKEFNKILKKGSLCSERVALSNRRFQLFRPNAQTPHIFRFEHQVKQTADVLNLHAYITDCPLEFVETSREVPNLTYVVKFLNHGGNHLPQDEIHMPKLLLVLFIVSFVLTAMFLAKMKTLWAAQRVHLIHLLCQLALILVTTSLGAQLLHLTIYANDGMGLKLRYTWIAADFLSEICQFCSELVVSFIFISISAFGWLFSTTGRTNQMSLLLSSSTRSGASPTSGGLVAKNNLFFLTIFTYIGINVVLQYYNRKYEEDFNYFQYNLQHTPGVLLIALRLLVLVIFLITIIKNFKADFLFQIAPKFVLKFLFKLQLISPYQYQKYTTTTTTTITPTSVGQQQQNEIEKQPLMSSSSSPNVNQQQQQQYQQEDSEDIQKTIKLLTIVGCVWFLSYLLADMLIFVLFYTQPSMQRFFTIAITLTIHIAVIAFLSYAFAFEGTALYKTSTLTSMGMSFELDSGGDALGGTDLSSGHFTLMRRKIAID